MDKDLYLEYCQDATEISVFTQPWWMDIVCGKNNWDVVCITENKSVIAYLPYYIKKSYGHVFMLMPPFTQYLGPWIKYKSNQNYTKKLSYEKKIINNLLDKLPKFDRFSQSFHPRFQNYLPFYWRGFSQKSKCTYILEDFSDPSSVFKSFNSNIKSDIKKAQEKLIIETVKEPQGFMQLMTLKDEQSGIFGSKKKQIAEQLISSCIKKNVGKVMIAKDQDDNLHAGAFFVEDHDMIHYLIGVANPGYKSGGASSLLLWSAIEDYSESGKLFNFEGSMIESVEKYFRAFGTKQLYLHNIFQTKSTLLKIKEIIR